MSLTGIRTRDEAIASARAGGYDGLLVVASYKVASGERTYCAFRDKAGAQRWFDCNRGWYYPGSEQMEND